MFYENVFHEKKKNMSLSEMIQTSVVSDEVDKAREE